MSIGFCQPGRSTSTSCATSAVQTPRIRCLVVCGLSETIATFEPVSALTSVDFPTFGRPATATKPDLIPRSGAGKAGTSALWSPPSSLRLRQVPRFRQQVAGRPGGDRPVRTPEAHLGDAPLVQPLAAAAARRGGDPGRFDVARLAAGRGSGRERRLLG